MATLYKARGDCWAAQTLSHVFGSASSTDVALQKAMQVITRYAASGHFLGDLELLLSSEARLEDCAGRMYLHGNGFFKIILYESALFTLISNVWPCGVDAEENTHEHRWGFASTILTGALHSDIYAEDVGPRSQTFDEWLYFAKSPQDPPHQVKIGETRLACVRSSVRYAGDCYTMQPNTLHRILRTGGGFTATLMCKSAAARGFNRLLTCPGHVADVEQRYLNIDEAAAVIRELVCQLQRQRQSGG